MADQPRYLANVDTNDAFEERHFNKFVTRGRQGVWPSSALVVSQHSGGANGTVAVAKGDAFVIGTEDGPNDSSGDGVYYQHFAAQSIDILGAHPQSATNPFIVIVGFQIQDQEYSGTTDSGGIALAVGTVAGSPVDPTLPDNFLPLARVMVRKLGTGPNSIQTADIVDMRAFVDGDYVISLQQARAQLTSAGTYADNVVATLALAVEDYDDHTDFNTSTGEYTAPASGTYAVGGKVIFGFNNATQRGRLYVYVNGAGTNGSLLADNTWTGLTTNASCTLTGSDQLKLSAGDVVTWRFIPNGLPTVPNAVQVALATGWIRRLN